MSFINFFVVNTCSIRTKLDYTCSNYTHYVLFQLTYLLRISTIIHCPRCSYWFIKTAITKREERCCFHCDSSELLPVLCFQIFRNILETEVVSIMEFASNPLHCFFNSELVVAYFIFSFTPTLQNEVRIYTKR